MPNLPPTAKERLLNARRRLDAMLEKLPEESTHDIADIIHNIVDMHDEKLGGKRDRAQDSEQPE